MRQYIGARYVPKFYENTQGGTDWESGFAYEPLTIVTYNGNSFTSKKTVPATVGAPNLNPEYWASTGIYNAQIDEYREEVQDIALKLTGVYPDDYEGTDSQKIQAAIDAVGDNNGVVVINRLFELSSNVLFKTHSLRRMLRIIGVGNNAGFKMNGFHFGGNNAADGGIFFTNILFTDSTDKIFDIGVNLIRLHFTNCVFYNNNNIFEGTYAQQVRLVNCRCSYFNTLFKTNGDYGCLSCSLIGCDFEDGHMIYENVNGAIDSNFVIDDCCIESFDHAIIQYDVAANNMHNIVIRNCYIEFIDSDYAIDLTNGGNNASSVFDVSNNYFRAMDSTHQNAALVRVAGNDFANALLNLENNQCSPPQYARYISIPDRTTTFRFLTRGRNVGQFDDPNNTMPIHNFTNVAGRNYITVMASFSENGDVAIVPVQIRDYNTFSVLAVRTSEASGDLDATKFSITRLDEDDIKITCSDTTLSAGKNLVVVFRAAH